MGGFACSFHVLRVAQRHFGIARPGAAGGDEGFNEIAARFRRDEGVALAAGKTRGLDAPGGNGDWRLGIRSIEQPDMIKLKVTAPIISELAGEQALNDLDRFCKALLALASSRPASADLWRTC